jgi:hypothetical protein
MGRARQSARTGPAPQRAAAATARARRRLKRAKPRRARLPPPLARSRFVRSPHVLREGPPPRVVVREPRLSPDPSPGAAGAARNATAMAQHSIQYSEKYYDDVYEYRRAPTGEGASRAAPPAVPGPRRRVQLDATRLGNRSGAARGRGGAAVAPRGHVLTRHGAPRPAGTSSCPRRSPATCPRTGCWRRCAGGAAAGASDLRPAPVPTPRPPPPREQNEWRALGVQQSRGWVHYAVHRPEPHIMLFRCVRRAALRRLLRAARTARCARRPPRRGMAAEGQLAVRHGARSRSCGLQPDSGPSNLGQRACARRARPRPRPAPRPAAQAPQGLRPAPGHERAAAPPAARGAAVSVPRAPWPGPPRGGRGLVQACRCLGALAHPPASAPRWCSPTPMYLNQPFCRPQRRGPCALGAPPSARAASPHAEAPGPPVRARARARRAAALLYPRPSGAPPSPSDSAPSAA